MADWDVESTKPASSGGDWEPVAVTPTTESAPKSSGIMDFIKSVPRGAVKGFMGFASDVGRGMQDPMMFPGGPVELPDAEGSARAIESVTGPMHAPEGTGGKYGERVGEFLGNPIGYVGPGGFGAKVLSGIGAGLGSEAASQLTKGSSLQPYAEVGGAMLGAKAPFAGARAITPLPIAPERQAMVNTLRAEGIEPTAGQVTGRKALKYAESVLGDSPGAGGSTQATNERVLEQFTKATLKRIGVDETRATPEVIDKAHARIGSEFDRLMAAHDADLRGPNGQTLVQDLIKAERDYQDIVPESMRVPLIENTVNDMITKLIKSPTLSGEEYKVLRSRLDKVRRGTKDVEVKGTVADFQEALDNAMERSMQAAGSRDVGKWQQARRDWRNLLVIEGAQTGAGETAASGLISPAKLRQGAVSQGRSAYARGKGDFADLARSGEAVLSPLPQSGTGPRVFTQAIPAAIGAAVGHGAGFGDVGPAIAGAMAPAVVGRGLMSGPVQAYLKNQGLSAQLRKMGRSSDASIRALLESLSQRDSGAR